MLTWHLCDGKAVDHDLSSKLSHTRTRSVKGRHLRPSAVCVCGNMHKFALRLVSHTYLHLFSVLLFFTLPPLLAASNDQLLLQLDAHHRHDHAPTTPESKSGSEQAASSLSYRPSLLNADSSEMSSKSSSTHDWVKDGDDFKWVEGTDVFTPRDLVGLPRPGSGTANPSGDLVLVAVSTYDFAAKK